MNRHIFFFPTIILLSLATNSRPAMAAPQTFNTALPVARGEYVFRKQILHKPAGGGAPGENRERNVDGSLSVLGYGYDGDLALFTVLPVIRKRLWLTQSDGTRIRRTAEGPGDMRLLARYTLFKNNGPGRSLRIAPYGGIEIPTGRSDRSDRHGLLPRPLQPGSGSWDPFAGLIVTYQTLDYELDAQLAYKRNTGADHYKFGDEFRADASLQYRLWPRKLSARPAGFLYGVLESNFLYRRRDRQNGVKVTDSGGTTLAFGPGLQFVTRRWIAEAIVQIPLSQRLGGNALEEDPALRLSIRFNF